VLGESGTDTVVLAHAPQLPMTARQSDQESIEEIQFATTGPNTQAELAMFGKTHAS
jgi:hypothetical protein